MSTMKVNDEARETVKSILSELPERCQICPHARIEAFKLEWIVELDRIGSDKAAQLIVERTACLADVVSD